MVHLNFTLYVYLSHSTQVDAGTDFRKHTVSFINLPMNVGVVPKT